MQNSINALQNSLFKGTKHKKEINRNKLGVLIFFSSFLNNTHIDIYVKLITKMYLIQ
jgi:hypothetical protein